MSSRSAPAATRPCASDLARDLSVSLRRSHAPGVLAALRAGARVDARDWSGATPLHRARDRASAWALLAAGADPAVRDTAGRTPLEAALSRGDRAVAWCLHGQPSALPVAARERERLLRHAAQASARPLVAWLLQQGVDPNAPDGAGRTPLHRLLAGPRALTHDGLEVARLLARAGAHWHCPDRRGRVPARLAANPPALPQPWRRWRLALGWFWPATALRARLAQLQALAQPSPQLLPLPLPQDSLGPVRPDSGPG